MASAEIEKSLFIKQAHELLTLNYTINRSIFTENTCNISIFFFFFFYLYAKIVSISPRKFSDMLEGQTSPTQLSSWKTTLWKRIFCLFVFGLLTILLFHCSCRVSLDNQIIRLVVLISPRSCRYNRPYSRPVIFFLWVSAVRTTTTVHHPHPRHHHHHQAEKPSPLFWLCTTITLSLTFKWL